MACSAVLTSVLRRVVLLSDTLMTKPCPSFSDQPPSYMSVLLNSFSFFCVQ